MRVTPNSNPQLISAMTLNSFAQSTAVQADAHGATVAAAPASPGGHVDKTVKFIGDQ